MIDKYRYVQRYEFYTSPKLQDVAQALERRKEFEENFTRTLRDLRKELEATDLKVASPHSPRTSHPGGNPWANLKSISHRFYLRGVAFERQLTKETIYLPLGCLRGGNSRKKSHVCSATSARSSRLPT